MVPSLPLHPHHFHLLIRTASVPRAQVLPQRVCCYLYTSQSYHLITSNIIQVRLVNAVCLPHYTKHILEVYVQQTAYCCAHNISMSGHLINTDLPKKKMVVKNFQSHLFALITNFMILPRIYQYPSHLSKSRHFSTCLHRAMTEESLINVDAMGSIPAHAQLIPISLYV